MHFFNAKHTFIAILCLMMAACATVPDANIENTVGPIPVGSGLVIAETMNNSIRITGPIRKWQKIILWKEGAEEKNSTFSISAVSGPTSTNLHVGAIPAGTYRIGLLWTTEFSGDFTYYAKAFIPPKIGTFEVKPGAVTNLGKLIYHPFSAKSWSDEEMPDYAITRVLSENLWGKIVKSNPSIASKIAADAEIIGWKPDEFDLDRKVAADLIFSSALPITMFSTQKKEVGLIGKAGGFYIKSKDTNSWSRRDSGTFNEIRSVSDLNNGYMLVGGENGYIALTDQLGKQWEKLTLPKPLSHVLDIGTSNEFTYVSTFNGKSFDFYQFNYHDRNFKWLKSLPFDGSDILFISNPIIIQTPKDITIYQDKHCHRFTISKNTWNSYKCTKFNYIIKQLDGTLIGSPYHSPWGRRKPLVFSFDNGVSWKTAGIMRPYGRIPFRTAHGNFLRPGNDSKFKLFKGWHTLPEVPFVKSENNGETWTRISRLPPRCVYLVGRVSSDDNLYVLCENGMALNSSDLGKNWQELFLPEKLDPRQFPDGLSVTYKRKR